MKSIIIKLVMLVLFTCASNAALAGWSSWTPIISNGDNSVVALYQSGNTQRLGKLSVARVCVALDSWPGYGAVCILAGDRGIVENNSYSGSNADYQVIQGDDTMAGNFIPFVLVERDNLGRNRTWVPGQAIASLNYFAMMRVGIK